MKKHDEAYCEYVELPPTPIEVLSNRVANLNNRVTDITPYTESKTAYIGDTTCEFHKGKDGMIGVSINGNPCDFEVVEDTIIAKFEPLEEIATIILSIQ